MTPYKTRCGWIDLTHVSLTEWTASAADLIVNGKAMILDPTQISLSPSGWSMYLGNRLRRYDGRRTTARAQAKVEQILIHLIETDSDPILLGRERWKLTLADIDSQIQRYQRQVDHYLEQHRQAACQLRAHELPGSLGEVARVLVKENWSKTPDELEETVQMLM